VNVELAAFSLAAVTSLIDNVGPGSSSAIVKVPVESLIVALVGLDKVNVTVSSPSKVLSSAIVTVKVLEVCPAVKVKVPLAAV